MEVVLRARSCCYRRQKRDDHVRPSQTLAVPLHERYCTTQLDLFWEFLTYLVSLSHLSRRSRLYHLKHMSRLHHLPYLSHLSHLPNLSHLSHGEHRTSAVERQRPLPYLLLERPVLPQPTQKGSVDRSLRVGHLHRCLAGLGLHHLPRRSVAVSRKRGTQAERRTRRENKRWRTFQVPDIGRRQHSGKRVRMRVIKASFRKSDNIYCATWELARIPSLPSPPSPPSPLSPVLVLCNRKAELFTPRLPRMTGALPRLARVDI